MNKKILVILATCALAISTLGFSSGCAKKGPVPTVATPLVTERESLPGIDQMAAAEADPQAESAVIQNPVMNFTGNYYNGKTTLFIEADGNENAKLTIVLSEDAKTRTVITADARFNPLTSSIAYGNGTKKETVFGNDGSVVSEKEIYTGGMGVIVFVDSEATWNDENEKIENMTFKFGKPDDIESGASTTNRKTKAKKTSNKTTKTNKKSK